jgi:hypothetical protein
VIILEHGEVEPLASDDDVELDVPDEEEMIRNAEAQAKEAGELHDFQVALKIAKQDSIAVQPSGGKGGESHRAFNDRCTTIFQAKVVMLSKTPTPKQRSELWNEAQLEAFESGSNNKRKRSEKLKFRIGIRTTFHSIKSRSDPQKNNKL